MDPGEQLPQDGNGMNMTRALEALAPYLKHPRRKVVEIEVLVCIAITMLFLQLFLAPRRRRSGNRLLQLTLWLLYNVSFPLMTYTFTQMASSPVKSGLYPFWAVFLLWAAGCTDVFTTYSLDDTKLGKRYLFDLAQYLLYSSIIYALLNPLSSRFQRPHLQRPHLSFSLQQNLPHPINIILFPLSMVVLASNASRIAAVMNATNSISSKLVADYMRAQVDTMKGQDEEPLFEPIIMKGYPYLLKPSVRNRFYRRPNGRREEEVITIKEIWDMEFHDDMLNTGTQGGSQLKLVSLSFALFHLLRRRVFGIDCAEAALPETHKFVLEGLLAEEDQATHYTTAFHIIEVELGFLYDVFFTKHAVLFTLECQFLIIVFLKFVFTIVLGIFLLGYFPTILTPDPIIEVATRRVDVIVTFVILVALLLLEALHLIIYFTSDWAIVSLAWSYTIRAIHPHHHKSKLLVSIIQSLRWFLIFTSKKIFGACRKKKMFGRPNLWQNKMGQSSLIECCIRANTSYCPIIFGEVDYLLLFRSIVFSRKTFQTVPALIRSKVVSCLRASSGPLTNGKAALYLNGIHDEFSWTLVDNSQTVIMLIWHIATEYCTIASSHEEAYLVHCQQEEKVKLENYQQVATTLSKYCAYLMFFIPELLPGNATDTTLVLHDIMLEGCRVLGKGKPDRDELLKAITDSESGSDNISEDSIFVKGLKLGRDLEKEDTVLRWKVMAEFWAETIIYIAPSDNVMAHVECLAQGGEFLTHVWALLTHAGILKRD